MAGSKSIWLPPSFFSFFLSNPVVISQYFVGGRVGRLFVTHSRTIGTHSHSRLVQEIAQERGTNGDEETRVYERQLCHREQGTPRKRASLGARGEFPFSPNTPFMPCFIPPWRLHDWPLSHSTVWASHPPCAACPGACCWVEIGRCCCLIKIMN